MEEKLEILAKQVARLTQEVEDLKKAHLELLDKVNQGFTQIMKVIDAVNKCFDLYTQTKI